MISNNKELFERIKTLSQELRKKKKAELANKLNTAITISTLPGEILGEVRLTLDKIKEADVYDENSIKEIVDESLKYLGAALR